MDQIEAAWYGGDLRYKMHENQLVIYDNLRVLPVTTRYRVVECARGFGKSWLGCMMAIQDCLREPSRYPVQIIGPEKSQTIDIVSHIINWIAEDAPNGLVKMQRQGARWRIGNNYLYVTGFNRQAINKLRGHRRKSLYLEECRDVDPEEFEYGVKDVLNPMLQHAMGGITMMTTPPKEPDHPYAVHIVPLAQLEGAYYKFTIYENPTITAEQINMAIKDCGGVDTISFRREYLCEYIRDQSVLVFPDFSPERHVREMEMPTHCTKWLAMDWGGVRDKTCGVMAFYDFERAKVCIWEEIVFDANTDTDKIVTAAREMEKGYALKGRYVDCPGQLQVDLLNIYKYDTVLPIKDDKEAGINAVQVALLNDKIEIHPRCEFVITSMNNGRYNKQRTDFERTEALGHCDGIDAVRYAWRMRDTVTNPFPEKTYDRDWQMPPPRRDKGFAAVAGAIFRKA